MQHAEIAEVLQVSERTSKRYLYQAREQLKSKMKTLFSVIKI
jgi:DNA-directed RNA polymerase specialized sigma24 family protein